MAMSLRPIRPQLPARTLSRNFRPQTDWREEEKATILLVYLPGFVREQVRTTYDESQRSIRLQGEQRLLNNRMRRVDERYIVPENCEGSKMETEFGSGILTVTLPKTKPAPAPEPKPKARMPQETSGDLRTRKGEEEMVSATPVEKQRGGDINVDVAIPGKTTSEMKSVSQTAGEETSSKTTSSTKETEQAVSTSDSKKQIDEGNVREDPGKKKERDETERPVKIIELVQGKERESKESAVTEIVVSKVKEKEKERIIETPGNDSKDAKVKEDVVSKAKEKEKEKIIELSGNDSKDAKVEIAVSKSKEKEKITEISSNDSKDAKVEIVVSKSEEEEKEKINYIPGNDSKDAKAKEMAVSKAEEKKKSADKSSDSGDAAASAKLCLNNHGNPFVNTIAATTVILGLGAYYFYSLRT